MSELNSQRTYLYLLYNNIIYDPHHKEYINILTLNKNPEGPLKNYTKLTSLTKPLTGDLTTSTKECYIVINNQCINNQCINNQCINNQCINTFLTLNDLNEFTEFLINNNYIITDNATSNNANFKNILYSFKINL